MQFCFNLKNSFFVVVAKNPFKDFLFFNQKWNFLQSFIEIGGI